MQTSPLVSVIIPCYNYGNYLSNAIGSVLNQEGDNFRQEIIVVDDGSSDNTKEVASNFHDKIRYVYQENQGLSAARNKGIQSAAGDFIVFLDADDILQPNVLSTHIDNFNNNPGIDLSTCHCVYENFDTQQFFLWALKAEYLEVHLCYANIAPVHSFMTRMSAINEAGFFSLERKACEDYDYWLRCAKLGKRFKCNPDSFVVYKQHGDSMSHNMASQYIQDITVKLEIEQLLDQEDKFIPAARFTGWLAYAAGILSSSLALDGGLSSFAQKLANHAAESLLKGAKKSHNNQSPDRILSRIERYYAMDFYINASLYKESFSPAMKKAIAFLSARYRHFGTTSIEKLKASRTSLNWQLLCDTSRILPQIKTYASQHSLNGLENE